MWSILCPVLCPSVQDKYWKEFRKGAQRVRDWTISPMRKGRENWGYVQPRKEKAQAGISLMWINIWKDGMKKAEKNCFQNHSVAGEETIGANWNIDGSLWTWGSTFFTARLAELWCRLNSCGVSPPWGYSKDVWPWSWATGSRGLLKQEAGPDHIQKSLPTSTVLRFC